MIEPAGFRLFCDSCKTHEIIADKDKQRPGWTYLSIESTFYHFCPYCGPSKGETLDTWLRDKFSE